MTTIRDVAKLANVSVATVSRVVNRKPNISKATMDAVNHAIETLNYRHHKNSRRSVKLKRPMGVMVSDVSNEFFGRIVQAVDGVARLNDKSLLITNGYHDAEYEREAVELLINNGCEAIVIHSKGLSDDELSDFSRRSPGLVILNRYVELLSHRCIYLDNEKGAATATRHLIHHGHRDIGYIGSNHAIDDAADRENGYTSVMNNNGIPFTDDHIVTAEPDDMGGMEAMSNLLAKNLSLTAVVAYNDAMASGAISVLHENGYRVPEDFSVIGFDDSSIARHVQPKLTTMRYPVQIMAEQAANIALSLALGKEHKSPLSKKYVSTLVSRASVKAIE